MHRGGAALLALFVLPACGSGGAAGSPGQVDGAASSSGSPGASSGAGPGSGSGSGSSSGSSAGGGAGVPGTDGNGGGPPDGSATDGSPGTTDGATGSCKAACGTHKWPCWPMPNPAGSGLPNPAHYTDLGSGAVRDDVTCLVWEKSPLATLGLWQDNSNHCASLASGNFAGYGDWRLPTRVEMASIVDFARSKDAVDTTAFPSEPSGYYRTGSDWYETITGQNTSGFAWIYGMSSGFTSNAYSKTTGSALVRCVRGNGAGEAQGVFAVPPPGQYTASGGEVTDNYTGLVWQQPDSSTASGAVVMPWSSAAGYCTTLKLNGHTWRVPSINELATLVDEARVAPAINRTAFPNTRYGSYSNNWYWASTTYVGSSEGWAINFDDGFTGYNAGTATGKNGGPEWNYFTGAWVRCVR